MTEGPASARRPWRPRWLSLRTRLRLSAALAIAVIVGGTTYLENRIIARAMETEALDAAAAAALGVAADLNEHQSLPTNAELGEILGDYTKAVPALRALTVTKAMGEQSVIEASTEPRPPAEILALAQRATRLRQIVTSAEGPGSFHFAAVPLLRQQQPYGAVVASLSVEAFARVQRQTRTTAFAFAAAVILVLTAAIDLVGRRLVHRPLDAIRSTMLRASAGDLQARAPSERADEIGALASGLNAMLERLGDFNAALREEVQRATRELSDTNRQLMESAQRLFAARRELARSEQLATAGQMAAAVGHQIGTPLNLISGYVQMILTELPPDSPPADRLRTVLEQIRKVTTIVQGLLDQARPPALEQRPTSPAELLRDIAELVRPTLDAARIALHLDVQPELPRVSVDVGQIEQAFLNLITNSVDAMPNGGFLVLSAHARDGQVDFVVGDSGQGIALEDQARVFDPLFTTKPQGQGTGLGLTIVRDVLAAHGGSVSLASRPGEGTTVTLSLPGLEQAGGA